MDNLIILIENGALFEGSFDQFEDCFFSFPDGSSVQTKISSIKNWATKNNWSVEFKDKSKIYA